MRNGVDGADAEEGIAPFLSAFHLRGSHVVDGHDESDSSPSVPCSLLSLQADMAAHFASRRPISIFMLRSSSTSSGLSRLLIGHALRSYSTGLWVRTSCGGATEKRTLLALPRPNDSRSEDDSRLEESPESVSAGRAEARRRKHGRSGIFGLLRVGDEERRLRDGLRASTGDAGGEEEEEGVASVDFCKTEGELLCLSLVTVSSAADVSVSMLPLDDAWLATAACSPSSAELRQTDRGLGTAGTVSLGLTQRAGMGGGPTNSNSLQEDEAQEWGVGVPGSSLPLPCASG